MIPPFGEVGIALSLPIAIGTGWGKYKISVPDVNRDEIGEIPLWLASGIVGFKKFFIEVEHLMSKMISIYHNKGFGTERLNRDFNFLLLVLAIIFIILIIGTNTIRKGTYEIIEEIIKLKQ